MEEFNIDFKINRTLNLDKVIKSSSLMGVTKLLASQVQNNHYMTPGDFIQSISNEDLDILLEHVDEDENPRIQDFVVMAELLSLAEGLDIYVSVELVKQRTEQLLAFLLVESLKRKDLVDVFYQNMSFGDDMKDQIIVQSKV